MSIVSFSFFVFLLITTILYYFWPSRFRWILILIFSLLFFLKAGMIILFLVVLFSICSVYLGTTLMNKTEKDKIRKIIMIITLIMIIIPLFITKYLNIIPLSVNAFARIFNIDFTFKEFNIIAPLGISYYTLSMIGYVLDVYWKAYEPEKNLFKVATFASFFPALISGPIMRFQYMSKELFEDKKINWDNIYAGITRVLFGLVKKLVIADYLANIVKEIFSNYELFNGYFIIIGVIFYAIQIYMDFSGCMDIVIGSSKLYGITLNENFDSPFYSKTLSEFWRRWHMSLGTWGKDYVMYPILKSDLFQKLAKKSKEKFGKKIGKKIPTIVSIFILWLLIGIWHGASFKYIFAAGILPWMYLTISQLFEEVPDKIYTLLKINKESIGFRVYQTLRTLALMCFIWFFVCCPSLSTSPHIFRLIFRLPMVTMNDLPQLKQPAFAIVLIFIAIIDYLKYKGINVMEVYLKEGFIVKTIVIVALVVIVAVFGYYGPGYNAVDFIYGGF